jgi:plastocyanin
MASTEESSPVLARGVRSLLFFPATSNINLSPVMTRVRSFLSLPKWFVGGILALGLWVGLLSLPASAQSGDEPAVTVGMTSTLSFDPDTVRIEAGQTVRWKNSSVIVHTVTADPEEASIEESVKLPGEASPFNSGNLDPKATFEHTFDVPGTYRYFCIPHEGTKMYGTVIVE